MPPNYFPREGLAAAEREKVVAVLGPIIEVDARAEILWPRVTLTDTGEESVRETADHGGILGKARGHVGA